MRSLAELNASAFGTHPPAGSFARWESAICGADVGAIDLAKQQAEAFNSSGETTAFAPAPPAEPQTAQLAADVAFWDIIAT